MITFFLSGSTSGQPFAKGTECTQCSNYKSKCDAKLCCDGDKGPCTVGVTVTKLSLPFGTAEQTEWVAKHNDLRTQKAADDKVTNMECVVCTNFHIMICNSNSKCNVISI